jgi:Flp pilus assembly protein TadG
MTSVTSQPARNHPQRGQELVELSILIPLLLLIAFGVLDLGRAFHAAITITNAAREGVRYGTIHPSDDAGIIAATLAEAQSSGIDLSSSVIEVTCPEGCDSGFPLRVTIQYTFQLMMGWLVPDTNLQFVRYAEMMVP